MTFKAIVFDIGGVLEVAPNSGWGEPTRDGFAAIFARWQLDGKLDDAWAAGAMGTITEEELYGEIGMRAGLTELQVTELMEEIWTVYLGVLNIELFEFFKSLRPRHRTGMISNSFIGARTHEQRLYGFTEACDHIVYSHEAGVSKPDPSIYRMCWEALDVQPEEMIFVDDVDDYLDAARACGIHAIKMTDNTRVITEINHLLSRPHPA